MESEHPAGGVETATRLLPLRSFRRQGWKLLGAVLLCGLALAPFAAAQKGSGEQAAKVPARKEPDSAELIRQRAEWFFKQRAFPLGFIPAGARQRALQQMEQMIQRQAQGLRPEIAAPPGPAGPTATWMQIGPQPTSSPFLQSFTSGRVTALVVDPLDSTGNTAYLGAAFGGVWKTIDGGITWLPMTDQQPSLAVGSIALGPPTPPNTVSTIYLGTGEENFAFDNYYGAGVLKSTDGGMNWTQDRTFSAPTVSPLDTRRGGPMIGALAVEPHVTAPATPVLLAAVQGSGSTLPSGVWRSTDGGTNWTRTPLPAPFRIVATDVVFDPADLTGQTAYAALGNIDGFGGCNGVYKSIDAGATWGAPGACGGTQLLPGSNFGRIALAIGPPNMPGRPGELFAAIADAIGISGDLLGVFKSVDGGATWTQLTDSLTLPVSGFCNRQCFYDLVIKVSPTNPDLVFAGGAATNATLIRSTNGGTNWAEVSNRTSIARLHVDTHALGFSANGNVLYTGNDGGVWSTNSPAGAITWTNLNAPLAITQFYPGLSLHPSNPAFRSFGGTQDNGTERYSGSLTWNDTAACGDGSWTAIDALVPSNVYATCEFVASALLSVVKSVQNGDSSSTSTSFFFAQNGIDATDRGNFIPPLVIDPSMPQRLYFGTCRVWQTADAANSWNVISLDLTGSGAVDCSNRRGDVLTTIAVAPSNSSVIYTGSSNGHVNVTTNAGPGSATWTDISTGLPTRAVTSVAADPGDGTGRTAYVGFSGFSTCSSCDRMGHVFRRLTAGPPWVDITGTTTGLPDIPVNDIVVDPDLANTLYAATDIGVFVTTNANLGAGTTWSPLATGLPRVAVLSLKLNHATRTLFAATHGRSVWSLPLGGLPTFSLGTLSPASTNAGGGVGFPLAVTGTGFTLNSVVRWTINSTTTTLPQNPNPPGTATQFTVTVPQAAIAGSGVAQVQIFDSSQPAPGTSNPLAFTVVAAAPTVLSIVPTNIALPVPGSVPLTVNGANFLANSTVQLVQLVPVSPGPTVNPAGSTSTQLSATIPQAGLQFGGKFVVNVTNPAPGGGPSCPSLDPTVCTNAILVATGPAPPNDNFANATPAGSSSFTDVVDSSGATVEPADPLPFCVQGLSGLAAFGRANSVWYKATQVPAANGTIEADTIGSNYDTILSVWTGSSGSLASVACNDDIVPGVNRVSRVTFPASAGVTYFFMVTAFTGDGGKTVFNLSGNVVLAPNYTSGVSPNTATVKVGQSTNPITLTVTPQAGSPNGTVALSCSGLPSNSSCNFSSSSSSFVPPNMVNLSSSPVMVTLTISTMAPTAVFPLPPGPTTWLPAYAPWLGLAAMALLFALWVRRRSPRTKLAFGLVCAFLLLGLLVFQVSCGGGGGGGGVVHNPGTPPGSYTVTVVGRPGSSGGQAPPAINLTVTP